MGNLKFFLTAIFIFVIQVFFSTSNLSAAVYYIDQSGNGSANGTSWANRASLADFNNGSSGKFDSSNLDGDTVCFSGPLSSSSNVIDLDGADYKGSSGNLITLDGSGAGDCAEADQAVLSVSSGRHGISSNSVFGYLVIKGFRIRNSSGRDAFGIYLHNKSGSSLEHIYVQKNDIQLYSTGSGSYEPIHILGDVRNLSVEDNNVVGLSWGVSIGIKIGTGTASDAWDTIKVSGNTVNDISHSNIFINISNSGATAENIYIDNNSTDNANRAYGRGLEVSNNGSIGSVRYVYIFNNYFKNSRGAWQMDNIQYISAYKNRIFHGRNVCGPANPGSYSIGSTTVRHSGESAYYGDSECKESCIYGTCSESDSFGSAVGNGKGLGLQLWGSSNQNLAIFQNTFHDHAEASIQVRSQVKNADFIGNIFSNDSRFNVGSWTSLGSYYTYDNAPGDSNPPGSNSKEVDCSFSIWNTTAHSGMEVKDNFFNSRTSDAFCRKDPNSTKYTLSQAQSAFSSGGLIIDDNINSDPMMKDPDSGDFSLTGNSPAVDRGFWTTVTNSTQTTNTVKVGNALLLGAPGTTIETAGGVKGIIRSIDSSTNTVTLASPIRVVNGEGIGLEYQGASLDAGAEESGLPRSEVVKPLPPANVRFVEVDTLF